MDVWEWIRGTIDAVGWAVLIWFPLCIIGWIVYWLISGKDPDGS